MKVIFLIFFQIFFFIFFLFFNHLFLFKSFVYLDLAILKCRIMLKENKIESEYLMNFPGYDWITGDNNDDTKGFYKS